jgi:hypothetical protein
MRPSLLAMTVKLSKLQRDLLIEHVDGLHPFIDQPLENATRESLILRELICYEPATHSILGIPNGTRLTDPDGREALCFILECYWTGLLRWQRARDEKLFNPDMEIQLQQALRFSARETKRNELRQQNFTPPVNKAIGHAYDRPAVPAKP